MASPKHITAVKRADGRMVSGIPLGEDFSAEDRVNALFVTRDAKDYVVSTHFPSIGPFIYPYHFFLYFPCCSPLSYSSAPKQTETRSPSSSYISNLLTKLTNTQGWGSQTFAKELKLLSASSTPTGTTTFSFIVEARHCNRMGKSVSPPPAPPVPH
jgi:hypothetical protein